MSLIDKQLETIKSASGYQFSATKLDKLGAMQYTLATVVVDVSYSVEGFKDQLEECLKKVFLGMDNCPQSDNLMFRVVSFNNSVKELHGFKLLPDIKEDDYTGVLNCGGTTSLFDAMDDSIQATSTYGQNLISNDYSANGIIVVITDGQNNTGSIRNSDIIKRSLEQARRSECLQSLTVILVGVTNDDDDDGNNLDMYLTDVKDGAGCDQYIGLGKVTPKKIAKLAKFISHSVSSTSSALASGTQSKPLDTSSYNF